jgi:hypothetical protein
VGFPVAGVVDCLAVAPDESSMAWATAARAATASVDLRKVMRFVFVAGK